MCCSPGLYPDSELTLLLCGLCRVDVLVNNAGIQPVPSCVPLHELPDELWDKVLDVNLSGIFRMSKLVIPVMLKQAVDLPGGPGVRGGGVIINISSVQGLQSQAGVRMTLICIPEDVNVD